MVATCLSSLTKRTNSSTVQFSQRRRNTKQRLAARHQSQETPSKRLQSLEDTTDLESQSPSITTSSTFQLIFTFFFSFLFFCFSQIFLLSIFFFFFFLFLSSSSSLSLSLSLCFCFFLPLNWDVQVRVSVGSSTELKTRSLLYSLFSVNFHLTNLETKQ